MTDIKQVAVIVGIAVIFTAFAIVSMEAFYESPKYEYYCNFSVRYAKPYPVTPETNPLNTNCTDAYSSEEVQKCYNEQGQPEFKSDVKGCSVFDSCNYCSKYYDDARKKHDNASFVILAIVGVLTIIFGVLYKIEFIGSGFMYGGIAILFYATIRFLGDQNKYLRVLILFIELLIVVWIGYKKLYKNKKK